MKKIIVIGSVVAVFLMLVTLSIPAVEFNTVEETSGLIDHILSDNLQENDCSNVGNHAAVGVQVLIEWDPEESYGNFSTFSVPVRFPTSLNPFSILVLTQGPVIVMVSYLQKIVGDFTISVYDNKGNSLWGETHEFDVYWSPNEQENMFYWSNSETGYWTYNNVGLVQIIGAINVNWRRYEWNFDTNGWDEAYPPLQWEIGEQKSSEMIVPVNMALTKNSLSRFFNLFPGSHPFLHLLQALKIFHIKPIERQCLGGI